MNYKAIIKRQGAVIALVVICLTIATIGASYALFFQVETNSNNQIVTAGTLDVSYGSGSSGITTKELVPISDEEALSSGTMTGTIYIENKGTLPAKYEVKLGDDTENYNKRINKTDSDELLSHEYLKVAAYLNGELIIEPTKLSDLEMAADDATMHSLFTRYINVTGTGNNTATIVLKIWISEDAPESIIGNYVYLKMDVTSEVDEREYIEVEYLESTGTQWIDTGFVPNQDTRVVADYQYTAITNSFLFGSRSTSASNAYTINVGNETKDAVSAYGSSSNQRYSDPNTNRHIIDKNKHLVYLDGILVKTHAETTFTAPGTLEIFASLNGSTKGYLPSSARIYSLKVYDNDTLIRDFIPVYRVSDKVAGLYDKLNDKFYTNSGTGTFITGSEIL